MYFIIIGSGKFGDFLSVNRMLYKVTKRGMFYLICYCETKVKNI